MLHPGNPTMTVRISWFDLRGLEDAELDRSGRFIEPWEPYYLLTALRRAHFVH